MFDNFDGKLLHKQYHCCHAVKWYPIFVLKTSEYFKLCALKVQ